MFVNLELLKSVEDFLLFCANFWESLFGDAFRVMNPDFFQVFKSMGGLKYLNDFS